MSTAHQPVCVQDAGRISELAASIANSALSPVTLVERCLARIEEVDPYVQAWRRVDGERALTIAREREAEARAGRLRGPLHGIPFGIKDVMDADGLDTLCNSRSREGSPPARVDAELVAAMKAAGAIVLGKVHTTEFSYFDPPPTRIRITSTTRRADPAAVRPRPWRQERCR